MLDPVVVGASGTFGISTVGWGANRRRTRVLVVSAYIGIVVDNHRGTIRWSSTVNSPSVEGYSSVTVIVVT
jgi:hypothetical protein